MSPKAKLAALLALFIVPTLASFVVFYFFPPQKSNNYGILIAPVVALPQEKFARLDGVAADAADVLKGKWLLVTRTRGACEEACKQRLLTMKQARLVLGRDQDRVVRVVLAEDGRAPDADTLQAFAGTVWIDAKSSAWKDKLPADATANADRIYGVDPLNNAFIFYGANPDIKGVAKDLRQVLKASQIG
jgi:cytochrome oxidase Cu insertion factor (SCO1/SenC/PrrC family)